MLRERDAPMHLFDLVPALGMMVDPVLMPLATLLDHDILLQTVQADLARRVPSTLTTGRPSTPVEVILRLLGVKHWYGWSDEQTAPFVADSLVLRQVGRVYAARVPDATTLIRWANLRQPATLPRLLDHVVALARSRNVTPGRQRRIDGTGVATAMHHPSASTLLYASARGLSRTLAKAQHIVQEARTLARGACRERPRRAKRHMKRIMEAARQRGAQAAARRQTASRRRLAITPTTVRQAQQVEGLLTAQPIPPSHELAATLSQFVPVVQQVVRQTTRRVIQGEAVPASATVVRLFEPPTAIIRQGKPGHPTACGRVLWWDEVAGGILSRYAVLAGNPAEDAQRPPSLDHHLRVFPRPPRLLAGDRGGHTTANER